MPTAPAQAQDGGKVAVLFGGTSGEREISILSGTAVLQALQAQGVDAIAFDPAYQPLTELRTLGVCRCFIALHGRGGEDGTVQGALELLGIPYTGSGVLASSIAMHKGVTKQLWRGAGLPTPDWRIALREEEALQALDALGLPMVVKPCREGSSLGVTIVRDPAECAAAYRLAAQRDGEVLCERFVDGDELTVAILDGAEGPQALPVLRIVAEDACYDYQNKYFNDTTRYCMDVPAALAQSVQERALGAYAALRCRGWARADVMVDRATQAPLLLEMNTSPGMTSHSLVPMAARAVGMEYGALCMQVLGCATLDGAP
ncbi:D-alanine--D-alanine ligase [Candidatus Symbiobacter mobilis]|nr:D-alanine--D-alanine ligase [Candidatus Symbiobacter mobilis]